MVEEGGGRCCGAEDLVGVGFGCILGLFEGSLEIAYWFEIVIGWVGTVSEYFVYFEGPVVGYQPGPEGCMAAFFLCPGADAVVYGKEVVVADHDGIIAVCDAFEVLSIHRGMSVLDSVEGRERI